MVHLSIFDILDSYMHICGILEYIWYIDPLLHPYAILIVLGSLNQWWLASQQDLSGCGHGCNLGAEDYD